MLFCHYLFSFVEQVSQSQLHRDLEFLCTRIIGTLELLLEYLLLRSTVALFHDEVRYQQRVKSD